MDINNNRDYIYLAWKDYKTRHRYIAGVKHYDYCDKKNKSARFKLEISKEFVLEKLTVKSKRVIL